MFLKNQRASVTIELLTFFLIISFTVWVSIGIFELFQQKTSLNKISYLAAQQVAFDDSKRNLWQDPTFLNELANSNNLQSFKVAINCNNISCKNGATVTVTTSGQAKQSIIKLNLKSEFSATSNKFSDDR